MTNTPPIPNSLNCHCKKVYSRGPGAETVSTESRAIQQLSSTLGGQKLATTLAKLARFFQHFFVRENVASLLMFGACSNLVLTTTRES